MKMGWKLFLILAGIFLISSVYAVSDTAVFQGQYYKGTEFQQGTYEFKFDIYTGEIFGDLVYSDTQNLTTGTWGQWRVELDGISAACNDTTKDYFVEITIDNSIQTPRRRLTHFTYLRKNVDETTIGNLTIGGILNFILGGYLQELTNLFILSKGLEIAGDLNVIGEVNITGKTIIGGETNIAGETKVQGQLVCLEDGTNCPGSGGSSGNYVSFVSTVDGDLSINDRYLPLGTDSLITLTSAESSWIIDRNLTITGILWNSESNTRTERSVIALIKSTSDKNSFIETDVSVDIQGQASGSQTAFDVSFSQGDLAVIMYESGGVGGIIHDLSVTIIGSYD